jgi:hypothetical protein
MFYVIDLYYHTTMSGSGSGSGFGLGNSSNNTFDCRLSEKSSTFITSPGDWQIAEGREVGTIIIGVILVVMFVVGTLWNLFIVITFFVKHHLLQEPANIFLLNVAIVDLLLCMTAMVFSFVTAFAQEYVFGSNDVTRCAVCKLDSFFFIFLIFLSLHFLTALSVDRFILLSRPLRYKQYMNRWKAVVICVTMYGVCFIIAILPILGFGQYEFHQNISSCLPRFTPASNFYFIIFATAEAIIPITILAITNVWTYRLVSKFLKKRFKRKLAYHGGDTEIETAELDTAEEKVYHKQQQQLVKMFGALLIGNVISYTPTIIAVILFLLLFLNDMGDLIPDEVYIVGFISFLTSAVVHPIIESFFVKELRYQVNRARKGVKKVGTSVYRQTTHLFINSKILDEAERRADDESAPRPKRNIRFLSGKVVDTSLSEMDTVATVSSNPHSTPGAPEKTRKGISFQEIPPNHITSTDSAISPESVIRSSVSVSAEPVVDDETEKE